MGSSQPVLVTIEGKVYDVTNFINDHPGGAEILLEHNGKDATSSFLSVNHSDEAKQMMDEYLLPESTSSPLLPVSENATSTDAAKGAKLTKEPASKSLHTFLTTKFVDFNILFYILTALLTAFVGTLSAWPGPKNGIYPTLGEMLANGYPVSGEAGLGRFLIVGKRDDINFMYSWRLVTPTIAATVTAWLGFLVHILGQFFLLHSAQKAKADGLINWSKEGNWYSRAMLRWNILFVLLHLVQTHLFYDGIAVSVPEVTAQASVVMILVVILAMEIPRRGLFLGFIKGYRWQGNEFVAFLKKYHSYVVCFGVCYDFWYHPFESTAAHFSGFSYMFLMIWQSSLIYHSDHRNRNWTVIVEAGVWVHGLITAAFQSASALLMFTTGFGLVFFVTQIWGIPAIKRFTDKNFAVRLTVQIIVFVLYLASVLIAYGLSGNIKKSYSVFFIPIAEYFLIIPYYVWFLLSSWIAYKIEKPHLQEGEKFNMVKLKTTGAGWFVFVMGFAINVAVLLSFAIFFSAPLSIPPVGLPPKV
ncbi:hypothetical protein HK096_005707 [Nowakowskiella sp. JEL0078]|nr:hypothetical protein HK096_005707 [Nowakowskiella sp. JEL0078]